MVLILTQILVYFLVDPVPMVEGANSVLHDGDGDSTPHREVSSKLGTYV